VWGLQKYGVQTTPVSRPVFSSETQFVPDGTSSLEVDRALVALGLPEPLPFFEKDTVVQSLDLGANTSTATVASTSTETTEPVTPLPSTSFLSYRVYGQSIPSVREAVTAYFISLGWNQIDDKSNQQSVVFGSDNRQIISINILEVASTPEKESHIVVALSLQVFDL
jgi:hypothetical protein